MTSSEKHSIKLTIISVASGVLSVIFHILLSPVKDVLHDGTLRVGRERLRRVGDYRGGVWRERVGGVGWSCALGVEVLVNVLVL